MTTTAPLPSHATTQRARRRRIALRGATVVSLMAMPLTFTTVAAAEGDNPPPSAPSVPANGGGSNNTPSNDQLLRAIDEAINQVQGSKLPADVKASAISKLTALRAQVAAGGVSAGSVRSALEEIRRAVQKPTPTTRPAPPASPAPPTTHKEEPPTSLPSAPPVSAPTSRPSAPPVSAPNSSTPKGNGEASKSAELIAKIDELIAKVQASKASNDVKTMAVAKLAALKTQVSAGGVVSRDSVQAALAEVQQLVGVGERPKTPPTTLPGTVGIDPAAVPETGESTEPTEVPEVTGSSEPGSHEASPRPLTDAEKAKVLARIDEALAKVQASTAAEEAKTAATAILNELKGHLTAGDPVTRDDVRTAFDAVNKQIPATVAPPAGGGEGGEHGTHGRSVAVVDALIAKIGTSNLTDDVKAAAIAQLTELRDSLVAAGDDGGKTPEQIIAQHEAQRIARMKSHLAAAIGRVKEFATKVSTSGVPGADQLAAAANDQLDSLTSKLVAATTVAELRSIFEEVKNVRRTLRDALPAPTSTVPESTEPGASTPESSVPESTVPDASAPESTEPAVTTG